MDKKPGMPEEAKEQTENVSPPASFNFGRKVVVRSLPTRPVAPSHVLPESLTPARLREYITEYNKKKKAE